MKKGLLCIFALLAITLVSAQEKQGIDFRNLNLSALCQKAEAEKKLVFVDVYASWCGPCKAMEANVYPQKKVGDYFNKYFVSAKYDAEKGEGIEVARKYHVTAYPTYLLLDAEGKLVGKMVGGSPADDFIRKIELLRQKALQQ